MLYNALGGRGPSLAGMVRRFLGVPEGITQLVPELGANLTLEVDRPEWSYLKGEVLVFGGNAASLAAATFSYVQLQNPTASDVIVVVDRIYVRNAAGGAIDFFLTVATNGPAGLIGQVRDTRWNPGLGFATGGIGQARIRVGTDSVGDGIGAAVRPMRLSLAANETKEFIGPWVIGPGLSLMATPEAVNTAIGASFVWRERPMFEMER